VTAGTEGDPAAPDDGLPAADTDPTAPVRHRLRDLDGRQRIVAGLLVVLLVVPFGFSMGRALAQGWVPSGDEAVIAVRVHDALSAHPPLTGLPSTSDLYGKGIKTRHLGPIEFYLLAVPARLLGPSVGILLGAGLINLGSLLLAAWVLFRRAGPGIGAVGVVLLAATLWSTGSAVLTDSISSNIGGYPFLALAVLAWALACGDHRLLPVTALVASFAAQQHLGITLPVLLVAAWGLAALGFEWLRSRTSPVPGRWRWVGAAALVGVIAWLPVAIDQATGHPGNLTAVVRFARDGHRATLGAKAGLRQVLRVAELSPFLARHDLTGFSVAAPLGWVGRISGGLVLLAMGIVAVLAFRRRADLSRLAATALVVAVAGFLAGSSVPRSIEADRINLYRWTWALALCTSLVLLWLVGLAARRWSPAITGAATGPLLAGCTSVVLTAALVVASVATVGLDDLRRDVSVFRIDQRLGTRVVEALGGEQPTMVVATGSMATLSVAPALTARLAAEGVAFQVPKTQADAYGTFRGFDPTTARSAVLVVSSFGPLPKVPGRRIMQADLHPDLVAAVDRLTAQVRNRPMVPSAKAPELLRHYLPALGAAAVNRIGRMATDPYAALTSGIAVQLLLDGYLASPVLDRRDLQRMQASIGQELTVWGDDRVAAYLLTIDQLHAYRPQLFE